MNATQKKIEAAAKAFKDAVQADQALVDSIGSQVQSGNGLYVRWSDIDAVLGKDAADQWEAASNRVQNAFYSFKAKFRGENKYAFCKAVGRG